MPTNLKPEHKAVKAYYLELANLTKNLNASNEGSVSPVFASLLRHAATQQNYTLVEQYPIKREGQNIRVDGALLDPYHLLHGLWEAKDSADDLDKEIEKKVAKGYPRDNILFQAPYRAVLYQDGQRVLDADITKPEKLIEVLKYFIEYEPPAYEQWGQAVEEFKLKVPELGEALLHLIEEQRNSNPEFVHAFDDFATLVRDSINPNISTQALEEMLIQHLLTERIFRTIFNNPDFATRNVIAREIEKVIQALTAHAFSRDEFLRSLDRFYMAIETTAATIDDFTEKQAFLNTVYEKFFQGFSVKAADVYGIVYTPQPIVNFMINSVEHILQAEFSHSLSDEGVHIIDPFVGTGNFIINIMRHLQKTKLPYKYANELHCNEVMLLPYYIASMNIEHTYFELTDTYRPFEGICLVDTFDINQQMTIFGHENTERIARQRNAPIFVVIANPPYNAGQVNENDNNKNRKYPILDKQVSDTYGKASKAQLLRKLNDPYIKAIRWATDRIGEEGVVAFVNNNSFISEITFDGMRYHLAKDFDEIYILDLGGNVRKNPKLSGTTHNVFGIQVGVSINLFVKHKRQKDSRSNSRIFYARVNEFATKKEKFEFLNQTNNCSNVNWQEIEADKNSNWLNENLEPSFFDFIPIGTKEEKKARRSKGNAIFKLFSLGVATNRDEWVYSFSKADLDAKIKRLITNYNQEVSRWRENNNQLPLENFINNNPHFIKWTDRLKESLRQSENLYFSEDSIRESHYRPFTKNYIYFDALLNQRQYRLPAIFPLVSNQKQNLAIALSTIGVNKPFHTIMVDSIPDLHLTGDTQCFPFYSYNDDGSICTENITDWALREFQKHYHDSSITKWDIFYYIYGLLHHPEYRSKYAANLHRELPRIPFAPDFRAFAQAGQRLSDLHVNYETQPEYPLIQVETPGKPLNWRVQKMKLSGDKTALVYNEFLTLTGIPLETYEYKLGNRSALEWIVDQYQVKTDKRSSIVNDPNNPDEPDYIVRLIRKIITVSLETIEIINSLPKVFE